MGYIIRMNHSYENNINQLVLYLYGKGIDRYIIEMIEMQLMSGLGDPRFNFGLYKQTLLCQNETDQDLIELSKDIQKIEESIKNIESVLRKLRSGTMSHNVLTYEFILNQLLGNLVRIKGLMVEILNIS